MRRFALVLVAVGCLLLGVTIVVATGSDRARARGVPVPHRVPVLPHAAPLPRALKPVHLPVGLRRQLHVLTAEFPHTLGPNIVPTPAMRLRPRVLHAYAVPGGSCEVAGGGCSLHPCVTYAGASSSPAVLRSAPTLVAPTPGGARAGRRACVSSAPAQRLVSVPLVSAVPTP